jgi:hypothetical protein
MESKGIYDVIYFEWDSGICSEFQTEIKERFPDAKLEDASDDIHGSRTAVTIAADKRKEYLQWLITSGFAALSFHVNLVISNSSMKVFDMEDDLKTIKESLEKVKTTKE